MSFRPPERASDQLLRNLRMTSLPAEVRTDFHFDFLVLFIIIIIVIVIIIIITVDVIVIIIVMSKTHKNEIFIK